MLDEVRAAIAEIRAEYQDPRVHYFDVEAAPAEGGGYALTGAVLDSETYAALAGALLERFPETCFDASSVEILRSPTPEMLAVATNLTGLHTGPSFGSVLHSQLLNGWPLEVLIARDPWVFVRQSDGYLGWAYRPYLAGLAAIEATHLVAAPVSLLRLSPHPEAPLVTRIPGGTQVAASTIQDDWAHLTLAGPQAGWAAGSDLRALGALPFEESARRRQIVADAERFIGVPYLWGGCTALAGIDCSGLAQLLYRLSGVELPRDADMQHAAGRTVEPPYRPGDLLFFWDADQPGRKIGHVGISLGGWQIVNASRRRNGVYVEDIQSVARLRDNFAGARSFLD